MVRPQRIYSPLPSTFLGAGLLLLNQHTKPLLCTMASLKTMFSFALLGAHALGGIQKSHADFGYVDGKGPVSWYAMNPKDWSTCATGDSQSPINIDSLSATVAGPIELKIQSVAHAEIENLGTTVEVNMTGLGSVRYGGTIYTLQQMHFHTPSEHHVNNVHNEMELHMVFKSETPSTYCFLTLHQWSVLTPNSQRGSRSRTLPRIPSRRNSRTSAIDSFHGEEPRQNQVSRFQHYYRAARRFRPLGAPLGAAKGLDLSRFLDDASL